MKYAWIQDQPDYPIRTMRRVLGVSRSGYYTWCGRRPGARAQARLLQRIEQVHLQSREAYGSERVWRELRRQGETCGRHRVRRLRQVQAIQSKRRRRYLRRPYQQAPAAPNLLVWPFTSPGPDRVWVTDITYLPTRQGWLYLSAVLDVYTRTLVGWAMGDRADQVLASAAPDMALTRRKPAKGGFHHSDQGVQYTCKAYRQHLQQAGLIARMSRKGMPYDKL